MIHYAIIIVVSDCALAFLKIVYVFNLLFDSVMEPQVWNKTQCHCQQRSYCQFYSCEYFM